ncbi:MAG: putative metal-dependent hydrolase [Flavobacteriales bacterium]|nr:putative metal-dependent hydrolase [Flavobacteriales bacterium]
MTSEELNALRFPVGTYTIPEKIAKETIREWIGDIEAFPGQLRSVVQPLSKEELNLRYRPDGWTIQQVVHHCADSHLNSVPRFKLAITEDRPTIKPYNEAAWAELWDTTHAPVDLALNLIEALHARWVYLLRGMGPEEWTRVFIHPEYRREYRVDQAIGNYAWHCRHHLAHVHQALALRFEK